jgi:hypothetical protein
MEGSNETIADYQTTRVVATPHFRVLHWKRLWQRLC